MCSQWQKNLKTKRKTIAAKMALFSMHSLQNWEKTDEHCGPENGCLYRWLKNNIPPKKRIRPRNNRSCHVKVLPLIITEICTDSWVGGLFFFVKLNLDYSIMALLIWAQASLLKFRLNPTTLLSQCPPNFPQSCCFCVTFLLLWW